MKEREVLKHVCFSPQRIAGCILGRRNRRNKASSTKKMKEMKEEEI